MSMLLLVLLFCSVTFRDDSLTGAFSLHCPFAGQISQLFGSTTMFLLVSTVLIEISLALSLDLRNRDLQQDG